MGESLHDNARARRDDQDKTPLPVEKAGDPRANSDVAAAAARARRNAGPNAGTVKVGKTPVQRYEALLGSWLGAELYNAVSDLITLDKLSSYARSGMDSALGGLGGLVKKADPANAGEVDEAVEALKKALGPKAAAFVKAHGEQFQDALQDFVDANPLVIVLIAMLAAAGAVAADMEIPELKHTFHVAEGLDVSVAANLGTLRNVTVEKIHAKIEYEAGALKASAAASYEPKKDQLGGQVGVDYAATKNLDLYARGSWLADVEDGGRLNPTDHGVRAGMRWRPKPNMALELYGEMDKNRGAGAGLSFSWKF